LIGVGTLVGLFSYLLANLGMGLQKHGAPALARWREVRTTPALQRLLGLWMAGSAMTVVGSLLLFVALGLGRASVIASFEGLGLVGLALYAHHFLGEPVGVPERRSIGAIVLGTALVGYFGTTAQALGPEAFDLQNFFCFAAVLGLGLLVLVGGCWASGRTSMGLAFGGSAGALAGLAMVIQKRVGAVLVGGAPQDALTDPWTLAFVAVAAGAFVLLQLAYLRGRAVDVVPTYASATILVPVVAGIVVYSEPAQPILGLGILLILGGVLMLPGTGLDAKESPP
jgi:uncharacterized membrane protein